MTGRWSVRKRTNLLTGVWLVHEPDGSFSRVFDTWGEAMEWATNFGERVEYWLRNQTRKGAA